MSGEGEGTGSQSLGNSASFLPWHLIPSFDPGETDLSEYARRLEFLAGIWPTEHLHHLAPRAAMLCKGSAFQKLLRVSPEKLKVNSQDGVKLIVTTLGGVWGKTTLETKYEKFEKALYGISQRSDESNDSYLARHEILFEDVISQGATLTDMRAYVLLRNSSLSAEDKKRVLVESKGDLKYDTVTSAIRMLGAKFFHDVQGQQKQYKTKTYDVNHVQEVEDDNTIYDEQIYMSAMETSDLPEFVVEQFIQEGDEDALTVQQFEEALIDTVQGDSEMTAYMNAYVEARKRLSEKSKSRGFWPTRGKGFWKKGKQKYSFNRNRKPLALRIAESECRLCGVKGHWKAECPRRPSMSSSTAPKPQAANVMVSATEVSDDDADCFLVENMSDRPVSLSDANQVPVHDVQHAHVHECLVCMFDKGDNKGNNTWDKLSGTFYKRVSNRLHELLQKPSPSGPARCPDDTNDLSNPSHVTMPERAMYHTEVPSMSERIAPPVPKCSNKVLEAQNSCETAMFATTKTVGILDLGASQTVMGQHQVAEFLASLPDQARQMVFEQPAQMTFRFGNNSVVPCHKAIFVPVDKYWIKIAVVETKTPFLISNNVCRSLGAVIDTSKQTVFFRNLGVTMPLMLSGKKLFLLDLSELIAQKPPISVERTSEFSQKDETVLICACPEGDPENSQESLSMNVNCQVNPEGTPCTPCQPASTGEDSKVPDHPQIILATSDVPFSNSDLKWCPLADRSPCHVPDQPCQALRSCGHKGDQRCSGSRDRQNELPAVGRTTDPLRSGQARPDVQTSGDGRWTLLPMVSQPLWRQPESRTSSVHSISDSLDRTSGACERPGASHRQHDHAQSQSQVQGHAKGPCRISDRPRGGGALGHHLEHPTGVCSLAGESECSSHQQHRGASGSNRESAPDADSSERAGGSVKVLTDQQLKMLEDSMLEFNAFIQMIGQETSESISTHDHQPNWVYLEMQQYFSQQGVQDLSTVKSNNRCDVLEIYCSSDSQLTKQCIRQGLRAIRFGLKEGDLSTFEGRCKLYDVLIRFRPRHIWMSPRCKAWCKWSQFNAGRSLKAAEKVLRAREEDAVHLMLCGAVFAHQCAMGPKYHFHLEQPIGSDMLFQEPLQIILENTVKVRCDLCTAGNLKHPNTGDFLQKGIQILTTSKIMARGLQPYICSKKHQHTPVAGSYRKHDGTSGRVSEYSELYTQMFAIRLARTIQANIQVQECTVAPWQDVALANEMDGINEEPESKRRRLNAKTSNPPGYASADSPVPNAPETTHPEDEVRAESQSQGNNVKQVLMEALQQAPRVGKVVLQNGTVFERLQSMYPDYSIRVVELCKGADRFRKPPVNLAPREAPWRMTLCLHRHHLEPCENHGWINWETYSNRRLCSPSPPSRIMITIFAQQRTMQDSNSRQLDNDNPEEHHAKRIRSETRIDPEPSDNSHDTVSHPVPTSKTTETLEPTTPLDTPSSSAQDAVVKSFQSHGARYLQLKPAERQWISKIHHNLGHPSPQKLKLVLSQQGYAPEIIQGVDDFRCSTCHELQQPKISRPAVLPEEREFNDCVGCDLITWTSPKTHKQFQFLHCIDSATNFQLAIPVFRTDAQSLFDALQDCWISWAGPCRQLVIDNASSLCSELFTKLTQGLDTHLRVVAAFAHWQLGRTERHGDILQHMLYKIDHDFPIDDSDSFKTALRQCCNAKNSLARHRGYTPEILVLGKAQRLPGSISEDHLQPSQYLAASETPEGIAFRQNLAKRECARIAFIKADNDERLRRAFLRRQRPHRGHLASGMFVMFWRPQRGETPGQWFGPARVIVQEGDSIVWVSHASRVYRVAPEHVRSLSEREALSQASILSQGTMSSPFSNHGKGVFQYEDLTNNSSIPFDTPDDIPTNPNNATTTNQENPSVNIDLTNQPDSEPSMPPISDNSSECVPTTPLSDDQNNKQLEPSSLAPHEIPVPEANDDELCLEDIWICQEHMLLRVHHQPRYTAFDPSTCDDCPVNLLTISGQRATTGKPKDQPSWSYTDEWGQDDTAWSMTSPWTGVTAFSIIAEGGQIMQTEVDDVLHVEENQGFECTVFFSHQDCEQVRDQPDTFITLAAAAAKRQRAEVKLKDLSPAQVAEFQEAKNKEIDQWLSTDTVRKILRDRIPERNLLRCRWVLTWKDLDPTEAAQAGRSQKAKARLVILGYEDPDLTEIPRDSPTLQKESRSLLLQYCASKKWWIRSFDVKTAFLRGSRPDNRILGIEPPSEMRARLHLKETEVCELLKSAYGLVNAPFLWYTELKETLLSLGFCMSPLDPCLFVLQGVDGTVHGILGTHVDDGLCGGDQVFDAAIEKLEQKCPFGAKRQKDFLFTGIHIAQDDEYNIHLDQKEYVRGIEPIQIERTRRKQEQLDVTETERQGLRGLIGSLQYAATNSRPDIAARLSFLQSKINCAKIRDLLEGNRLLGEAKKHADVTITISSIPLEQIRMVSYSDASPKGWSYSGRS